MGMDISLQTVAQNSRAILDMLNAQANEGMAKGRIGIRKDGQITVFKGMEFVLHLRQCHRAKQLLKAQELIAERKSPVSSLVRIDVIAHMHARREYAAHQSDGLLQPLLDRGVQARPFGAR